VKKDVFFLPELLGTVPKKYIIEKPLLYYYLK